MPMSLFKVYAHLIFSTKERQTWLDNAIRERVHAYLASLVRDMNSPFVVVGGPDDHIHILFQFPKQATAIDLVRHVKSESSKFVKTLGDEYGGFSWQRGYGMFSVGPTRVADVEAYIRNQVEHHKHMTFQDEFKAFLQKYKIDFDEKYVWD